MNRRNFTKLISLFAVLFPLLKLRATPKEVRIPFIKELKGDPVYEDDYQPIRGTGIIPSEQGQCYLNLYRTFDDGDKYRYVYVGDSQCQ